MFKKICSVEIIFFEETMPPLLRHQSPAGDGAQCDDPSQMAGNTSSSQLGDAIAAGAKPKRASAIMRFSTRAKKSGVFAGSGEGEILLVNLSPFVDIRMQIDLGCFDRSMTKVFLDNTQIFGATV